MEDRVKKVHSVVVQPGTVARENFSFGFTRESKNSMKDKIGNIGSVVQSGTGNGILVRSVSSCLQSIHSFTVNP